VKNILVPIDFSSASETALHFAIGLNALFSGKLHFLHIFETPYASSPENTNGIDYFEKLQAISEKRTLQFIEDRKGDYHFDSIVSATTGGLFQAIASYAQRNKIDLIVSGNKQKTELINWFSGSITRHLLAESPCPVVAVPDGFVWIPLKNIVVFLDLSETLSTENCTFIKALQKETNAKLSFIHIENKIEAGLEDDAIALQQINIEFGQTPIILPFKESFEYSIHQYLNQQPTQLLVTIPHHHSWLDKLFLGTETGSMAKWAEVPIMSLVHTIQNE
jgi:nucleotide-binding universal stress UspA family protein